MLKMMILIMTHRLNQLQEDRRIADYDLLIKFDYERAEKDIEKAEAFIEECRRFI
jgi:uncharacterized protein (UPF0332 family)